MPKKLKGGTLWEFPTSILSQNSKKIEEGALWGKKNSGKKIAVPKKLEGGPFGMVRYAGKQEKPFGFSSLDQIVQFGAIIFCRTFKNYFGQFVWIAKKRKATIIVAFHFMKRRLKRKATIIVAFHFMKRRRKNGSKLSYGCKENIADVSQNLIAIDLYS